MLNYSIRHNYRTVVSLMIAHQRSELRSDIDRARVEAVWPLRQETAVPSHVRELDDPAVAGVGDSGGRVQVHRARRRRAYPQVVTWNRLAQREIEVHAQRSGGAGQGI